MTPPSPHRGTSPGSTLMSLCLKGKVKIINVDPIDGLAGGHGGSALIFGRVLPLRGNEFIQSDIAKEENSMNPLSMKRFI